MRKVAPAGDGVDTLIGSTWRAAPLVGPKVTAAGWLLPHRLTNGVRSAEGYRPLVWMECVPQLTLRPCLNAGYLAASCRSTSTHSLVPASKWVLLASTSISTGTTSSGWTGWRCRWVCQGRPLLLRSGSSARCDTRSQPLATPSWANPLYP